jgi:hypothetical protein
MAARKKASRKGAPKGKAKGSAAASRKKKASKKVAKKRKNRKAIITALVRRPMAELVKKGGLISEAITVKVQRQLVRKGQFIGPRPPTAKERAASKREAKRVAKLRRLENLEKARAARLVAKHGFIGPIHDPQAQRQHKLLHEAGVAGY